MGSKAAKLLSRNHLIGGLAVETRLQTFCLADVAPLFWIGASLYAVGNGGFGPIPSVYAIDVLPPEHRGLGIGVFRSAGDFGAVAGHHARSLNVQWKPHVRAFK